MSEEKLIENVLCHNTYEVEQMLIEGVNINYQDEVNLFIIHG